MIKVCHMTSVHTPLDVRIFHKECTSLANAGYDVTLVEVDEETETRDINGVHVIGVNYKAKNRFDRMLNTAKAVYERALAVEADIYHLHDPELLPFGIKLHKQGKKVIFDSHECYTELIRHKFYLPSVVRNTASILYGKYQKFAVKKFDCLIFPCLKNGKHLFEGDCKRVINIDNYPKMNELYDKYDAGAEKYPRSIVYIGLLTEKRGVTDVVKAGAAANCTVYLGGRFDSEEYEKRLTSIPEYSCVKYLGPLNRAQVVDLLAHCQIGMAIIHNIGQYNQYDNLATKTYEYMSLGLPVLLTKAPYNNSVVDKYKFGICVDPENTQEVTQAINYILDNPDIAKDMGENGRKAVMQQFNWTAEEKKLLQAYSEIQQ